jgi:hypothetical protein
MTDREKLIAELRELAGRMPPICDRDRPETILIFDTPVTVYCKPFEQFQDVLRRAADALADDGVTVQEWISIKDRLPDTEDVFLCWSKDLADMMFCYTSDFRQMEVTHWMPLPEPPKGE